MKLLLLNDSYFGDTLKQHVDQVLRVGPGNDNDIRIDPDRDDLFAAVEQAGFKPDAILQVDSLNRRVFFKGLERFSQPMAFYAVDTPINDFWQRHYAAQFDRVWVDQHKVWRSWAIAGIDWARWLPLAADTSLFHPPTEGQERDIPILFVGSVDPLLRPKRSAILYRLRQIADVHVVDGGGTRAVGPQDVADLYRRATIVVNELLFDGINLRSFEAMACGAVLLTEQSRGEEMLFTDGYSLVTFNQSNLENVVQNLLDHPSRPEHIGHAGAALVLEKHTLARRANQVVRDLEKLRVRRERFTREARDEALWGVMLASLKWRELETVGTSAVRELMTGKNSLDPFRYEILVDLTGQALFEGGGFEMLGVSPSQLKIFLASRALSRGETNAAGEILDVEVFSPLDVHMELGKQLYGISQDMTPGFNRSALPVTLWTAFEHFLHIVQNDPENREALEHLDRILIERDAVEFTLPLWQRFHLYHPKDREAERILIQRARMGYVLQPGRNGSKETSLFPLRSSSRRTAARMPLPGTGAGRS